MVVATGGALGVRVALLVLVACSGPPPLAPIVEGPIDPAVDAAPEIDQSFWIPGERLRYDLRFRGVVLAEMNMAVGEPGVIAGREVVVVRSRAATAGVVGLAGMRASESATSWIDRRTGGVLERHTRVDDNGDVRAFKLRFSPGVAEIVRIAANGDASPGWDQTTPADRIIYDNQGILGLLRGWRPAPGTTASYWALTDRILNRHVARYSGAEIISTATRHARADRYDADIYSPSGYRRENQSYRIWITADDRRTPLRMEIPHRFGRLILELREHRVGRVLH